MNNEYIQNLRYKLQKRVRRLNSIQSNVFHATLKQFWGFLQGNEIFVGILEELEKRYLQMEKESEKIVKDKKPLVFENENENAAVTYFVIKKCVESEKQDIEWNIGGSYRTSRHMSEMLDVFRDLFLEPFYEYIDEQLDDQRAILALLRRYKHRCEWFRRNHLFNVWNNDTKKGEKHLSMFLYEYLLDQGIDFNIEPKSVSGEADLVAAQKSDDPLIADVKIFEPNSGRGKDYIAKGFDQIYQYTLDYNEPFGYLIIFKTCKEDLRFALSNISQSTPFVIHNNKTIFLITIDIFPHEEPASKRGTLKTIEITEKDLIKILPSS